MKSRLFLLLPALAVLAACDRGGGNSEKESKPERVAERRHAVAPAQLRQPDPAVDGREAGAGTDNLSDLLYEVPDDELGSLLELIRSEPDPASKQQLLTTFHEETGLRPAFVRLPLLLELALQPEIEPSLRTTIMAELGTTLSTDHGASWADWALAIDEHLAVTEGFQRVD